MSRVIDTDHIQLFTEHMHTIHIPHGQSKRRRPLSMLPATVIAAPRRPWHQAIDCETRIRRALMRLVCDEGTVIEGVWVQRSGKYCTQSFHVAYDKDKSHHLKTYTLESAVSRVLALANR